jgi:hypothetical protein
MSLLLTNARRIASLSVKVTVLALVTPRRLRLGGVGKGRAWESVKIGSRGSVSGVGEATGSPGGGVGIAVGDIGEGAAAGGDVDGTTFVPGGVCGADLCVPGAAVGLVGRVASGWFCPCPGGRVASRCAGFGVETGLWPSAVAPVIAVIAKRTSSTVVTRRIELIDIKRNAPYLNLNQKLALLSFVEQTKSAES